MNIHVMVVASADGASDDGTSALLIGSDSSLVVFSYVAVKENKRRHCTLITDDFALITDH